jgi:hypothetical protein
MRQRQKPGASRADEQAARDQEVLRATKELAAYFKGKRTEREARAALKIIKAFVRGREQLDPRNRPPLPGLPPVKPAEKPPTRKRAQPRKRRRGPDEVAPPPESALAPQTE